MFSIIFLYLAFKSILNNSFVISVRVHYFSIDMSVVAVSTLSKSFRIFDTTFDMFVMVSFADF